MVTDSQLVTHLREIILTSDLWTTTATAVRRRLEAELGVDLSSRRMFIMKHIDEILYGRDDGVWDPVVSEREGVEGGIGQAVGNDTGREDPEQGPSPSDGEEEEKEKERSKRLNSVNEVDATKKDGIGELCTLPPQLHNLLGEPDRSRIENITSDTIIVDFNKSEKLNGDNYETWRHKIWYVLDEHDALEGINHFIQFPSEDLEAYQVWKKKDLIARSILVSSVVDDLIHECERFSTAHEIWMYLREKYGGISVRQLVMEFDTYKKHDDHSIKEHLRTMSSMIRELRLACHFLSDEQQVQALIRSLPDNWEYLKVNLNNNDNFKTFVDAARHVEFEDVRLGASKVDLAHNDIAKASAHVARHVELEDEQLGTTKVDMTHKDTIMTFVDGPRHVEHEGTWPGAAKVGITRRYTMKTFLDATRHELEDDHLGGVKSLTSDFVTECNAIRFLSLKRKRNWKKGKKEKQTGQGSQRNTPNPNNKNKKRKFGKQDDKSKMKCFNCYDFGHFARECPKRNKIWVQRTT